MSGADFQTTRPGGPSPDRRAEIVEGEAVKGGTLCRFHPCDCLPQLRAVRLRLPI